MERIHLPHTDLQVSRFAFGTADCGTRIPEDRALRVFEAYRKEGGNFLDTAHCYAAWVEGGLGVSERWVAGVVARFGREGLVIATKGGHCAFDGYPRPDAFLAPEIVERDLSESLDRLRMDAVDLYYLHRDDPRVPVGELVDACNRLADAGRVRHLGVSNWSARRLADANAYASAHGLRPFAILQNHWSLMQPSWESLDAPGDVRYVLDEERAVLEELGVPVAAWAPVRGIVELERGGGWGYGTERNRRRLAEARRVAAEVGATEAQVALAYLLRQRPVAIPILGTGDEGHLREALAAEALTLSDEQLARLENA
ncbi:MAG: aldo/keto reductase [Fimbriimonadales bacterium]|nr:aldo/keto reductase [Fimbriimonadales bacterium]